MKESALEKGQIPLGIGYKEKPGFDLFLEGNNKEVLQCLKNVASGDEKKSVYIWGLKGTGKSHLLQATCMEADEINRSVAYIPLVNHSVYDPDILQDLHELDLICIDDIDLISGHDEWERSLLHLYNKVRDNNRSMLITGSASPQLIKIKLQDLKSRLAWDLIYHLDPLSDLEKTMVLQQRANARAFELPVEVADYLVNRVKRDLPNLIEILDQLDEQTMVKQKKLTIPFVKSFLEINE